VRNGTREFVLEEDAAAGADPLVAASRADLPVSANGVTWADPGPARICHRTWLDTFDWRLYRAGLTLEQVTGRAYADLVLTGRDGDVLAAEQLAGKRGLSWPRLLAELPAGPLRELIEPVVDVRALLPVARATSRVSERCALNGDAKTVARLCIDRMAVTYPARTTAPPRLRLVPVRGYQAQSDRIGQVLGGLPGVSDDLGAALDTVLAAAGSRPAERPGKASAVQLTPAMPAAKALSAIFTSLLDALEANIPGAVRDIDTEFLHDLRIAVRWTRSALKLCGRALPDGLSRTFRPEFRWLGGLTAPARDLDVYLLGFSPMAAGLVGAAETDLGPFHDYLVRSRRVAYADLARGLRSARLRRLTSGWRAALADVRPVRRRPTAAQLAAERIGAAQRRALAVGRLIHPASPAESLHELRKRCKELRYLVEMFGSLHDPAERWQAVRELKLLQDCLGEFQDAEVQKAEIRAFAAQMMADRSAPAATLLAMGEIAAGLTLRQRQARSEFHGRFAGFASPDSQARLAALTRAAA
jgi:CHAD domain-containing protein